MAGATASGDKNDEDDDHNDSGKEELDAAKRLQPLLPKSAVLRLLAELVRAYSGCAYLITQHVYTCQQSELVNEECSALSFILDHLLPQCQDAGDKDCPSLARLLLASIAASNHSPDAQAALVHELKAALQRALAMVEGDAKHARIQALTSIVSTVMEACALPGALSCSVFKHSPHPPGGMNNMVKLLIKRGLVTDLARIPHSLDLSSPNMANTMNAALKPLETLSRIVNQPQTGGTAPPRKPKAAVDTEDEATAANTENEEQTEDGKFAVCWIIP